MSCHCFCLNAKESRCLHVCQCKPCLSLERHKRKRHPVDFEYEAYLADYKRYKKRNIEEIEEKVTSLFQSIPYLETIVKNADLIKKGIAEMKKSEKEKEEKEKEEKEKEIDNFLLHTQGKQRFCRSRRY